MPTRSTRSATRWALALILGVTSGCGSRTELALPATEVGCLSEAPPCVAHGEACAAPTLVAAACDAGSQRWTCPNGTRAYARAPPTTGRCLPFRHASGISSVGAWGLGSFARIPTDDGRCLWIADNVTLADGTSARNVALEPDSSAPFGTCPDVSLMPPTPIVTMEGGEDPSIVVQIAGGYRLGGATHVLYRLFRLDPSAVFGAVEMGGGVGRWDQGTQRIVLPSPNQPFPWGLDLDLGDAALLSTDGTHSLVWGCAQPGEFLEEACELGRLDANDSVELLSQGGTWIRSTEAALGLKVFGSGTWTSSVVPTSGGPRHVYVVQFGRMLQTHVAGDAKGPWSDGANLGSCDLPGTDPHASCAGPVVHEELSDPTRPGELAITYGVGTTGTPSGMPDDYWPRLIWAE